jgi:NADH-quinone oxidoreductase subunit C
VAGWHFGYNCTVETLEQIKARIEAAVPGAQLQIIANDCPANQPSLLVESSQALAVARFLHDDSSLGFDYASNMTAVDWPDRVEKTKVRVKKVVDGAEKEVEETAEKKVPGYLEAVYHLYSMEKKHGPMILRQRTSDRKEQVQVASLTPVWRGCEFQEREAFDLYGIRFEGHPDLRRILMWDGFKDHPMRKDYVEPADYEYEPTPHDDVLEKASQHQASPGKS